MLRVLAGIPEVDQQSITITDNPWQFFDGAILFELYPGSLLHSNSYVNVEALILDDEVARLSFCGELGVTLGEAVERAGEPDGLVAMFDALRGRIWVSAVDFHEGVEFSFSSDSNEIGPEVGIGCLSYFDAALYEEMLEAGMFSMGHYNAAETRRIMYPWIGYGSLVDDYPPREP